MKKEYIKIQGSEFKHFLKTYTKKQNKYGAKKSSYKGIMYDSRQESEYAMWLDSLLKEGKIKKIERQKKYTFIVNCKHITTHKPDFLITLNDGRKKIVEVKGFPTELWPVKKRLFEALYPNIPYLVNPNEKKLLL